MVDNNACYIAWKEQDLKSIKEQWDENTHKRCLGAQLMLREFLKTHETLSSCVACIEFFWNAPPSGSKHSRHEVIRKELIAFKNSPLFGSITHHLFIHSLVELNITTITPEEEQLYKERDVLFALRSATLPRLGNGSIFRRMPAEMVRLIKAMLTSSN